MQPLFSQLPKPFFTTIVFDNDPEHCIASIRNAECGGAHAFALDMRGLRPEFRNKENLEKIIKCTSKPVMYLSYRGNLYLGGIDQDDEWEACQLEAMRAGAAMCDMMGDLFDPSPLELTTNAKAIDKQKKLIDKIHGFGREVLMSAHMNVAASAEQTLEYAKAMEARGVDIVKLVMWAGTPFEMAEAFRTTALLAQEMKTNFIHICNGQYGRIHRYISPMLGAATTFTVPEFTPGAHKMQPPVHAIRAVYNNLQWQPDRLDELGVFDDLK